jgi:hypothetical protein
MPALRASLGSSWIGFVCLVVSTSCTSAAPPATPRRASDAQAATPTRLEPKEVLFGLRSNEESLRSCFEHAANTSEGLVRASWLVLPSGAVTNVRIEHSKLSDSDTLACLQATLAQTHFGRPQRELRGTWTFVHRLHKTSKDETAGRARDDGFTVEPSSPGRLDRFDIQSTVNGGFGLYAYCFRQGFLRNPALRGRVKLRFVIERDGSVARVSDGGSDLPDQRSIDCIAEGFFALEFPKPEAGPVYVLYPVLFNEPEDGGAP